MERAKHPRAMVAVLAIAAAWLLAVAGGLGALWRYSNRPGSAVAVAATPPQAAQWPEGSALARDAAIPTLVLFVHPMCPCSHASAEELARLMARCGTGRVKVEVSAVLPAGAPATWEQSALLQKLRAIPGVQVTLDRGGCESKLFAAETSGQTLLYDPAGRLLFRGGITPSRGHQGDNAGSDAIVAIVSAEPVAGNSVVAAAKTTDVFGCSLRDDEAGAAHE